MKWETTLLLLTGLGLTGYGAYSAYHEAQSAKNPLYQPKYGLPILAIGGGLACAIPALHTLGSR